MDERIKELIDYIKMLQVQFCRDRREARLK